jgi:hypothetical protein
MKEKLERNDPWQTHTYLNTSKEFEKLFTSATLKDRESFK